MSQQTTTLKPQLREAALQRLEDDFDKFTDQEDESQQFVATTTTVSRQALLLQQLNDKLDYLAWLSEGPDDYDTIDETISPTSESRYNYDPYTLWALSVTNNAATGGPNLLFRLTDSYGRIKQYKIPPQMNVPVKDMRGNMGSVFNVIASAAPGAEMICWVSLKWPRTVDAFGPLRQPEAHQAIELAEGGQ